jgi:hypothetical protein
MYAVVLRPIHFLDRVWQSSRLVKKKQNSRGRAEKMRDVGLAEHHDQAIDMMSHNVYFATKIFAL